MKRSAGELRAEMLKAARGAGAALGTAEDLAAASAWMDDAALAEALAWLERDPAWLDALIAETDLAPEPDAAPGAGGDPLQSALIAARSGGGRPSWPREISDAHWRRLTALAARTYVPESAASRAAGAGAGDIDND